MSGYDDGFYVTVMVLGMFALAGFTMYLISKE